MQREPSTPVDGGYETAPFIMESAKELQQFAKFLPDTAELPTTHEHFVETRTDARGLTIKYVGVREKAVRLDALANAPLPEADGLNAMSDADLETVAAKVGVTNYPRKAGKSQRVAAIREARAKAGAQ